MTAPRNPSAVPAAAYARNVRRLFVLVRMLAEKTGETASAAEARMRGMIGMVTGGEDSTKTLDANGWVALFQWFNKQGVQLESHAPQRTAAPERRGEAHPGALPTGAQKNLITALVNALNWSREAAADWMRTYLGFPFCRTRTEAGDAIDGLKAALVRQSDMAAQCELLLSISLPTPELRAMVFQVHRAITTSRNASAARPGQVLKVAALYREMVG